MSDGAAARQERVCAIVVAAMDHASINQKPLQPLIDHIKAPLENFTSNVVCGC